MKQKRMFGEEVLGRVVEMLNLSQQLACIWAMQYFTAFGEVITCPTRKRAKYFCLQHFAITECQRSCNLPQSLDNHAFLMSWRSRTLGDANHQYVARCAQVKQHYSNDMLALAQLKMTQKDLASEVRGSEA
ncbi:hypothetical protein F0562_018754 [Nyssa sinensis]|uniref:Uncharacterized protein n=1 Tax=Nyssa sinensis TaxID=561372 RepID=A0A5J4ZAN6_9ASTE|nr:hypothetical protein F0562_018754 [Nyssa sinensis]